MSVANPVVAMFDGETRRIYLKCGVGAFHWISDIYAEYHYKRAHDENFRVWFPLLAARGGELKENGVRRESYVVLLQGTKVIPCNETGILTATGEIITDSEDQYPFDLSLNELWPTINLVNPNGRICYNLATEIETMDGTVEIESVEELVEIEDYNPPVDIEDDTPVVEIENGN